MAADGEFVSDGLALAGQLAALGVDEQLGLLRGGRRGVRSLAASTGAGTGAFAGAASFWRPAAESGWLRFELSR